MSAAEPSQPGTVSEPEITPEPDPRVAAIEIVDLHKIYSSKSFDSSHAVDGLTITVPQRCFFGFLGPNGAGKTTTIKMLMGLVQPNSGSMHILGLPLPEKALEVKKLIGLVPDDSLLFDYLTGFEYLEFIARLYGLPRALAKERASELLNLFELGEGERKLIGQFSKGMRKRVAMAAALIHRPRLFLMDEPFEGVDAVGARLMKDILLEQVRGGATVFLTSHVLEVVERLCDRVAIINRGKLIGEGTIPELRAQAASEAGSLEEIFVSLVGADRHAERLPWL